VVVRGRKPFKIEKVERTKQDENFKVKVSDNTSHVHTIALTFTPTSEPGMFEEQFFVTVSGRPEPIAFKASGRVMDQSVTVTKPTTTP
jgi:hypothetical protein